MMHDTWLNRLNRTFSAYGSRVSRDFDICPVTQSNATLHMILLTASQHLIYNQALEGAILTM